MVVLVDPIHTRVILNPQAPLFRPMSYFRHFALLPYLFRVVCSGTPPPPSAYSDAGRCAAGRACIFFGFRPTRVRLASR